MAFPFQIFIILCVIELPVHRMSFNDLYKTQNFEPRYAKPNNILDHLFSLTELLRPQECNTQPLVKQLVV